MSCEPRTDTVRPTADVACVADRHASPETASAARGARHACMFCGAGLREVFVDLGMSPLCESYLSEAELDQRESFYPLAPWVCDQCFLVQLPVYVSAEDIYSEYAYFSSYSESWLAHARGYVEMACQRFHLHPRSQVVEIASNDGYLLQYFVARGVPTLGVEPAANVARAARAKGVPTRVCFFGVETARALVNEGVRADLLVGNNVYAHIPDINDFTAGLALLLADDGVLTLEFPHLARLVEGNQFDTIYHEHFCYHSFTTASRILAAHGLRVFDVEQLTTHGGSLRVYAERDRPRAADAPGRHGAERVAALLAEERALGVENLEYHRGFHARVIDTKHRLLEFLVGAKRAGKRVVGYGAPGKGNTLLNYCGIRTDFLDFTVDRNPYKQGKFLPGTHIPICAPEALFAARPDYILILPWNLKDEIIGQLAAARSWGAKFVIPIPQLTVID